MDAMDKNMKNRHTLVTQFFSIKVGLNGVCISRTCFLMSICQFDRCPPMFTSRRFGSG